jgi:hypothetical protein
MARNNINNTRRSNGKKRTRQGMSNNTKMGNKLSSKHYKKKYRGQGKKR